MIDSVNAAPPALLLIDLQQGFLDPVWGESNNPALGETVAALLRHFRGRGLHVWHVRHNSFFASSPLREGEPGFDFLDYAAPLPGEEVFIKRAHAAFVGTHLERRLREAGVGELVIAGLTTDHCVSTTTRLAYDLGFSPVLIADACATFPRFLIDGQRLAAEVVHLGALASLNGEFGRVCYLAEYQAQN